jgi:hypothetical protein
VPAVAVGVIAVLDLLDTSNRTIGLEGTEFQETLPVGAGFWFAVFGVVLALVGAVPSITARSDPSD